MLEQDDWDVLAPAGEAALDGVLLGCAPVVDRQFQVVAMRLTVLPADADAPPDTAALVAALGAVCAGEPVLLTLASEALLGALATVSLPEGWSLEIPAFLAADPQRAPLLAALRARGQALWLRGGGPVPPGAWSQRIVEPGEPVSGAVLAGAASLAEVRQAFAQGAQAVLGWPLEEPLPAALARPRAPQADLATLLELVQRVQAQEPIERIEALLRRDPALAFKLLRYVNAPAFGLKVEITSFGHAVMLLGYRKLQRWLVLLLAAASRHPEGAPLRFAALRRGLLMEELGRDAGADEERRNELFVCGVFSLLEGLLQQPLAQLLRELPVPGAVRQALTQGDGPLAPWLQLARAAEAGNPMDLRQALAPLLLGPGEAARALLRALAHARQLDG